MLIILDYKDTRPIYEQIVDKLEALIIKGVLLPDEQMPSVRSLAMELSINPNTIQKAYSELERRGYLYSIKGRGNFVSFHDELLSVKRNEYIEKITKLLDEAAEIGIKRGEIIEKIKQKGDLV